MSWAVQHVGKEIILLPKTQHGHSRVKEYGKIYTITKIITGIGQRYRIMSIKTDYERWINVHDDKHFNFKLL